MLILRRFSIPLFLILSILLGSIPVLDIQAQENSATCLTSRHKRDVSAAIKPRAPAHTGCEQPLAVNSPVPTQTPPQPNTPPAVASDVIAYIGLDGNVYVTSPGQTTPTPITTDADVQSPLDMEVYITLGELNRHTPPTHLYCCVHWSPDATQFTFVDKVTKQLFLAVPGQHLRLLASSVTPVYPASAWSPDGTQIAYLAGDEQHIDFDFGSELSIIPVTGGKAHTVATINAGCERDGPGPELAGYIVDSERGTVAFFNPLSLDWTPWGLLYGVTDHCQGIALVSPDGKPIWQNDELMLPVVSPDHIHAVAYDWTLNKKLHES